MRPRNVLIMIIIIGILIVGIAVVTGTINLNSHFINPLPNQAIHSKAGGYAGNGTGHATPPPIPVTTP